MQGSSAWAWASVGGQEEEGRAEEVCSRPCTHSASFSQLPEPRVASLL